MKKLICLLTACILLLTGCTGPREPEHVPVLPPARTGSSSESFQIVYYDFESAFAKADIVALVRIGDWLGERNVDHEAELTYYSASVIRSFKGNAEENFVLCQEGNSKVTMNGFQLFTYGDEMLLCLGHYSNSDYEDMYYIVGTYGTVMYALPDASGETYLVGIVETMGVTSGVERIKDPAIKEELAASCSDPILKEQIIHSPFICRADDYYKKLEALSEG